MVIGFDASRANTKERSGVEWYSYHLLDNLYKIDDKNRYFLYTPNKLAEDLKHFPANFQERILKWPFKRFWTKGRMSLEMIANKPDVLFVPAHVFPLVRAKKNVITWHDVGYEHYPETYTKWELASLKQGAHRACKSADIIITISNFTKKEIIKFYNVDPDRIKVIHLGCNHDRWHPIPAEAVKQFRQERNFNLPYFIYLGRLSLRKNIVCLIRMYNRFRQEYREPHNLILVGVSSTYQNDIENEINISPYKNEIKKIGWLAMEQLPILVSGAQALVFPSIYEGFGLPAIEAMACGCPVIASDAGSLPEVIGDAGLLEAAHNINGFVEKMIKVIEDSKLRQDLINKGLIRAKQFSWGKCAKETLEVLESV